MKNSGMNAVVRDLQALFDVGAAGAVTDGQLLDRFVSRRDEISFEVLARRLGPMVWGVCRRVLRDHHDAEEAFQATFLVLARKAATVEPREKVGHWLYGVAYRTALKARSTREKSRRRETRFSDGPEPEAGPLHRPDERLSLLDQELGRLPERYRIAILLCDLEGKTHKEAADQLGLPVGTVSSRLSRARQMLAKRMTRQGVDLSAGSLAAVLAREAASAGIPGTLVASTARAASLYAAGGAVTAGVVSAKVVTLTGEVLKMMLLSKLKVVSGALLVVGALSVGGTDLVYRATAASGPAQKKASGARKDQDQTSDIAAPPAQMPVPTVLGPRAFRDGDVIEITDVRATSPRLEPGDSVTVRGRVRLDSQDQAHLCLFLTQTEGDGSEEIDPAQRVQVKRGLADFELKTTVKHRGFLHLSLYDSAGKPFGGVYFGTAPQMEQIADWSLDYDASAPKEEPTLENVPPVVVKTEPLAGSKDVKPGPAEIHITFSKPMMDKSWSWSTYSQDSFPKITGKPHYAEDGRTCVLPVDLEPGKTYAIWVNSGKFHNFKDQDQQPAVPYLLVFQTREKD